MKRLCIFYYKAYKWVGRPVQWIVCKQCQKKLRKGEPFAAIFKKWWI